MNSDAAYIAVLDQDLNPRMTTYSQKDVPREVTEIIREGGKSPIFHDISGQRRILLWDETDDIYLLKDLPLQELTRDTSRSVVRMVFVLIAVFGALSVGISLYVSKAATRRLKGLTSAVIAFGEGDLNIHSKEYGIDEIGTLASSFNQMVEKINELINQEYKAKLLQKNAELQMLQARIKPHFINNTLQAMGTLGLKRGARDVYLMANALARTLRYTLKSTAQLLPLQKELENMNDYLYIQNILWSGRLQVDLDVETGLGEWPVPVFILQPLVENSIQHGLENSAEGTIRIRVRQAEENLLITVSDNGCGIPPDVLERLQSQLCPGGANIEEHIGIRNIVNRMSLIYGESAGLTIDSAENEGTSIQITLPRKEKPDV